MAFKRYNSYDILKPVNAGVVSRSDAEDTVINSYTKVREKKIGAITASTEKRQNLPMSQSSKGLRILKPSAVNYKN